MKNHGFIFLFIVLFIVVYELWMHCHCEYIEISKWVQQYNGFKIIRILNKYFIAIHIVAKIQT